MNNRHTPQRQCISCNGRFSQTELLRVAQMPEGIIYDKTYRAGGRGAYICRNADCIGLLIKKRRLDRAFKKSVPISVYEEILNDINRNA